MITSSSNPKVKYVHTLQSQPRKRKDANAFVIEGVRLIEEAIAVGWPFEFIFYDHTLSDRGRAALTALPPSASGDVFEITSGVMAMISDTDSPQGILAVLKHHTLPLPASPSFVILADQIRDPGNMGTILRTAEATGADMVIVSPGTVDPFSPKVMRAGMGAHFHLPIVTMPWQEIHRFLKGLPIYLASSDASKPLWAVDFSQPSTLLIGGEAFGASPLGEEMATDRVSIPMPGRAESLNAAVAAGIMMAEVMRQRQLSRKAN